MISIIIRNKAFGNEFFLHIVFYDYVAAVYMANCIFNELKNKVNISTNRSLMGIRELQMKKRKPRCLESPEVQ